MQTGVSQNQIEQIKSEYHIEGQQRTETQQNRTVIHMMNRCDMKHKYIIIYCNKLLYNMK